MNDLIVNVSTELGSLVIIFYLYGLVDTYLQTDKEEKRK